MTETASTVDLPPEWYERPEEDREGAVRHEYRCETPETAFSVPVVGRERAEMYEPRLTVVEQGSHVLRHDYPVAEYDSPEAAVGVPIRLSRISRHSFERGRCRRRTRRSTRFER